jgi:hypothetical protein
MSEETTRTWSRAYLSVILVEILVLMGLLWLQTHFRI